MTQAPIVLPHNYIPREYQIPVLSKLDRGIQGMPGGVKRAVMVDHRRCGKDKTCFNFMVKESFRRIGSYYYFFPTYNQGRKILWDGADKEGFKFLDHVPKPLIFGQPNSTEMKVNLILLTDPKKAGSLIQIVGSDNIDSIVGTNPIGCVFSEFALQDPRGWDFIRPILRENGGWAIFPFTPRGKNHGWDLYLMAKENPDWYTELLTIDDTYGHGGTVGPEEVDAERRAGMSENLIQQEYYVSFEAAVEHAVFGQQLWLARNEKRICNVPWIQSLPVNTYWDLGRRDACSIWFEQTVQGAIRFIDFYEVVGSKVSDNIKHLREKPYIYGSHYLPHDGGNRIHQTGKSTQEVAWELGFDTEIVDRIPDEDQINAARMIFNRCWFDETNCEKGLDSLSSYHYEYDSEKRNLSITPLHDWSSHASKAFELMAVAHRDEIEYKRPDRYAKKQKQHRSFMAA